MSGEATQQAMEPVLPVANEPGRSAQRRGTRLILVLALVATGGGFWLGTDWLDTAERERDPSGLDIPIETLDFGHAWAQSKSWNLRITNHSQVTTRLQSLQVNCHCTDVMPKSVTLRPGQGRKIELAMDLSPHSLQLKNSTEFYGATLVAQLDRAPWYVRWPLSGVVHSAVVISPTFMSLEQTEGHSKDSKPHAVRIDVADPGTRLRAECETRFARVKLKKSASGGTQRLLVVTPRPDLSAGTYSFPVRLHATVPEGEIPQGLSPPDPVIVPITLTVHHIVRPGQSTVHLGIGRQGRSLTGDATLISAERLFTVRAVSASPAGSVEVDLPPAEASMNRSFAIRVPRAIPAHHQARLTFKVVHPATGQEKERVYDVTIQVVYDGVRT